MAISSCSSCFTGITFNYPCQQQLPVRVVETANHLPQLLQMRNTSSLQVCLGLRGSDLGLCSDLLKTWCLQEVMELELSFGPSSAIALLLDMAK